MKKWDKFLIGWMSAWLIFTILMFFEHRAWEKARREALDFWEDAYHQCMEAGKK